MPLLRRLAGLALLAGAYVPVHRLLTADRAGPAGIATRDAAESAWTLRLSGSLIVLAFAWVCTRMVPESERSGERLNDVFRRVAAPAPGRFAVATGLLVTAVTAFVAIGLRGGEPTSVDELTQLLHAQALAAGLTSIPLQGVEAAWIVQNGMVGPEGWVSIYPPLHTAFLALGLLLGVPWLVGPVATGIATACTTWTAERLLGPAVGRLSGLLLIASPFWIQLGATYLSHTTAVAGLALLALALVRARDGGEGWYVVAGIAAGIAVSARPWTGLAVGSGIGLSLLWRPPGSASARPLPPIRSLAWLALGGLPFALLLLTWNQSLFGHPFRLGYAAAFGPAHGLGLHVDPWGNSYGLVEALAYTGADLVQMGVRLFESPLPALTVIGLGLLLPGPRGPGIFGVWAAAALVANALYWHHGIHFGPRMLYEAVPAFVVLFASQVVRVFASGGRRRGLAGWARWAAGVAIVAGVALVPSTLFSLRGVEPAPVPDPPTDTAAGSGAIVFVHGSWASRISARLAATGMRRDSIETALRRNDVCAVDRYARARENAAGSAPDVAALPPLDFTPRAGSPTSLETRLLSAGNPVRVDPAVPPDAGCLREAQADRLGILELELLAWRLPPLGSADVVVARDLGPAGNLRVLERTARTPWVFLDRGAEGGPLLLGYSEGMELLWGGAAGDAGGR